MAPHRLRSYNYSLYLRSTEGWVGLIRYASLEEAQDVFDHYQDDNTRLCEGIQSCWIMDANMRQIFGKSSPAWAPDGPVYENDTRR